MSVIINFPKLEKALRKDKKNIKLFYEKGVLVLNKIAFVCRSNLILAVNLTEFFIKEQDFEDEEELFEIEKILFHLNEKVFNKEYWSELTNVSEMEIIKGQLKIENPKYSKTLIYKYEDELKFYSFIKMIESLHEEEPDKVSEITLSFDDLKALYDVYSTQFKKDQIQFQVLSNGFLKFTFKNRKHFYGYIQNLESLNNDDFKFELCNTDIEEIINSIGLYKEKKPEPLNKKS